MDKPKRGQLRSLTTKEANASPSWREIKEAAEAAPASRPKTPRCLPPGCLATGPVTKELIEGISFSSSKKEVKQEKPPFSPEPYGSGDTENKNKKKN